MYISNFWPREVEELNASVVQQPPPAGKKDSVMLHWQSEVGADSELEGAEQL